MRILSLFLFIFLGLALNPLKSQTIPGNKEYYAPYSVPFNGYYGYLKGGLNFARSEFGATPDEDEALLDPFIGRDGMGGSTGFAAELGYRFPWKYLSDYGNKLYITSSFGGSFRFNALNDWYDLDWEAGDDAGDHYFNAGIIYGGFIDIASGISYNLKNKVVFEVNYYLHVPLVITFPHFQNRLDNFDNSSDSTSAYTFEIDPGLETQSRLATSLELVARIRHFSLGLQWFRYKARKQYEYTFADQYDEREFVAEFDWTTFQLMLGVCF